MLGGVGLLLISGLGIVFAISQTLVSHKHCRIDNPDIQVIDCDHIHPLQGLQTQPYTEGGNCYAMDADTVCEVTSKWSYPHSSTYRQKVQLLTIASLIMTVFAGWAGLRLLKRSV